MPKILTFLWQLCHNVLPDRGALLRRGLPIDPICLACLTDIEDNEHLFALCPFVKKVWELAITHGWLCRSPFVNLQDSLQDTFHDL